MENCDLCHYIFVVDIGKRRPRRAGMVGLAPKWVRLAPNGTNPGFFSDQISVHLARGIFLIILLRQEKKR